MSVKKETLPEVSASSTKKDLLDAYLQAKALLDEKAGAELKPEQMLAEKRAAETITTADALGEQGVVQTISELKMRTGRLLSELAQNLETETVRYAKLKEAIALKQAELDEIYEIGQAAQSLAALIEANKQKRQSFEAEMSQRKQFMEEEIRSQKSIWEKEKAEHLAAVKEQEAEEKKTRDRQREEFAYAFKREQELARNSQKDLQEKIDKELAARRESLEKELMARESAVAEREKAAADQEGAMAALRLQVENFSRELTEKVDRAVQETTVRLQGEAKLREALLQKEAEGIQNVLKARLEAQEKQLAEQAGRVKILTEQQEKAYGKVQEIAVKAVEGSGHKQILANIEQLVEKSRTPAG